MKSTTTRLAVLMVAAVASSTAWADGFRNPPPSVSALARTGGNIAFLDDASALAINPANLAFEPATSVQVGAVASIIEADFRSAAGLGKESTDDPLAVLPHAFVVSPLDIGGAKIVAGLGVTVPYGRSSEWDNDVAFAFESPYSAELRVIDIKPTIAAKLSDTVAVGAGLDIYYSDIDLEQMVPWSIATGIPTALPGVSRSEGDGWAVGANAAVTWNFAEGQRLAFVYRSAFDVDYEGDFHVSNVPPPAAGLVAADSSFDTTIKYPHVFALGYGVEVSECVKVGVDFEYITHSRFENLPVDLGVNNMLLPASSIQKDWDDNFTIGASAAWEFEENWTGTLGYVFIDSPIPDRTFSPLEADSDEHLISLGLEYKDEQNRLQLMYALGLLQDRNIDNNIITSVNGDYEFSVNFVGLSYQRAF